MDRQEIREGIWQFLQETINSKNSHPLHNQQIQLTNFEDYFKRIIPNENWTHESLNWQIVREEIHGLCTANILLLGYPNGGGAGVFTISMFGIECINASNILPFDPDGYVKALKLRIPTIDDIVVKYLHESVVGFSRQLLLSSTITLGAASEKMIIVLIETFANAISNSQEQSKFKQKIEKANLYKKYELFKVELANKKSAIPPDLLHDFDVKIDSMFNFIRLNRNKTGHPTGNEVTRPTLQSNLQIFSSYTETIYALIEHLKNHTV